MGELLNFPDGNTIEFVEIKPPLNFCNIERVIEKMIEDERDGLV